MKKILSVHKPPITSYMTHAPVLSILSNDDKYLPWFFLNYIQMRVRDDGIDFYNFYTAHYSCPFFDTTYLSRDFISKHIRDKSITEFLIKCIDDGYYVIALIDTSFIKLYPSKKAGDTHPIFIYGYDENNKTFNVADFFDRGKYSFEIAPFNEIELAYINCDNDKHWQKGIHLLGRIEYDKVYFPSNFVDLLNKYIQGNETSVPYNHLPNNYVTFGLESCYNRAMEEIMKFKSSQYYDNRLFPIFCEHKVVLKMMCEYLSDHGCEEMNQLREGYNELYEKAFILRNKWIKCNRQQTNDVYNESELLKLKNLEINLIKRTIVILENMDQKIFFNEVSNDDKQQNKHYSSNI